MIRIELTILAPRQPAHWANRGWVGSMRDLVTWSTQERSSTDPYSIVLAGAGVPGGQVIGRSDPDGAYVADQPHTPEDFAATVYEKLGIDRQRPLYTSSNRPVYFGHGGQPIQQLF